MHGGEKVEWLEIPFPPDLCLLECLNVTPHVVCNAKCAGGSSFRLIIPGKCGLGGKAATRFNFDKQELQWTEGKCEHGWALTWQLSAWDGAVLCRQESCRTAAC